jgi:hypothetical protein
MGEAKRRKKNAGTQGPVVLGSSWERAAGVIIDAIKLASAEGMQVFLRPTTTPSPHAPDRIKIETAQTARASRLPCSTCRKSCAATASNGMRDKDHETAGPRWEVENSLISYVYSV